MARPAGEPSRDVHRLNQRVAEELEEGLLQGGEGIEGGLVFTLIEGLVALGELVLQGEGAREELEERLVPAAGVCEALQLLAGVVPDVHLEDLPDLEVVLEGDGLLEERPLTVFEEEGRTPVHLVRDDGLPAGTSLGEYVGVCICRVDHALEAVAEEALEGVDVLPDRRRRDAVSPCKVGPVPEGELLGREPCEAYQRIEVLPGSHTRPPGGDLGRSQPEAEGPSCRRSEDIREYLDEDPVGDLAPVVEGGEILMEPVRELLICLRLGRLVRLDVLSEGDRAYPLGLQVVPVPHLWIEHILDAHRTVRIDDILVLEGGETLRRTVSELGRVNLPAHRGKVWELLDLGAHLRERLLDLGDREGAFCPGTGYTR